MLPGSRGWMMRVDHHGGVLDQHVKQSKQSSLGLMMLYEGVMVVGGGCIHILCASRSCAGIVAVSGMVKGRAGGVITGLVRGRSAGTVCSGVTSGRAGGASVGFFCWCGGDTARIVGGMVGIVGGKMCGAVHIAGHTTVGTGAEGCTTHDTGGLQLLAMTVSLSSLSLLSASAWKGLLFCMWR
jgi:hypothetical protein